MSNKLRHIETTTPNEETEDTEDQKEQEETENIDFYSSSLVDPFIMKTVDVQSSDFDEIANKFVSLLDTQIVRYLQNKYIFFNWKYKIDSWTNFALRN